MKKKPTILILLWLLLSPPLAVGESSCPRIISQSPYLTHTLDWLGLIPCIVGASRYDQGPWADTGGVIDPDIATIRALEPQLAITTHWTDPQLWGSLKETGSRTLILDGFQGMAQITDKLRQIAAASGLNNGETMASDFERQWRDAAGRVGGQGQRSLLISPCGGQPWLYGEGTWLYELFQAAGFAVQSIGPGVQHVSVSEDEDHFATLLEKERPELVFAFINPASASCQALIASRPVSIIPLPAEQFTHPAPGVVLEGLEQLAAMRGRWQTNTE
ncbi:MAG: ABC transporter substrate-binding protein [Gammaproteobacteria bacterium]|nr:ABC transporter substrate-binding protein [Gammaproteobacteria bacterium]